MSSSVLIGARPRDGMAHHTRSSEEREVEVTRQVILDLFHMRQADAATSLSISLSSLKSACRRLGFPRWPYSRHRPTATHLDDKTDEEASGSASGSGSSAPGAATTATAAAACACASLADSSSPTAACASANLTTPYSDTAAAASAVCSRSAPDACRYAATSFSCLEEDEEGSEMTATTPCLHEAAGGDWEGERGIDTSWLERYMQSTDEDEV
ncbi:hypothetical protein GUITHDRAFT_105665 [Guillardia theta CCMP2712]|uniref:RWP-RK domain-containing protein n=1 Tax=Guillardia theta (strain CCMP2712) TaxID=905079 RepID=L1JKA6_GUITC|nr:hypothetical protein GUITHDRAFT_105665 [Guillardia theta CCMP2712]EKX48520.1 hypothetical protein GUITHDRAFT_105665 [Guillardia theta CCMP2712]|eukprot:XP_005835500.1 hypothetical protein GUITHDRAFT_105665 [Guillardia theta CCMP2712]